MKKNLIKILCSTFLLSAVVFSSGGLSTMAFADAYDNEKVNLVIESINSLDKATLTSDDELYVKSIKTMYNSLSDSEKQSVGSSLVAKLDDCIVYVEDCVTAHKFSSDIDYYVANPSFNGEKLLEEKQNEYDSFSSQVKSLIKNFTLSNKKKILDNVEMMVPEIYYDFSNPTVSDKTIVNQGKLAGKDAYLNGNASVENGYLSFGLNADIDGSYVRLPNEMFETGKDFTIALEYERTTNTDSQGLMCFGTESYTTKGDGESFGFRTSIHTGYDRGPMTYLKTKNSSEVGGYTGILHANGDGCNHLIRVLIRYISEASCLQICEIDTNNNYYMYVNQGCSYPSYNQYTKVKASNMPLSNMNLNVLGAYNGLNEYLTSTEKSFEGKIYTFAFYNRCVTEFELFGKDNRDMYIGSQKVFEYINNFEYPENEDVFYEYRDEYGKMFSEIYNDVLTVPYDFRFLFDQEKLALFLQAYSIFQSF